MRYFPYFCVLSMLATPVHAQEVADFAAPCFVDGQTEENAVAGFEEAGWAHVVDEASRIRIAEALGVARDLLFRFPRGEVTSEAMDNFVQRARSEGVRSYAAPLDVLLFEQGDMVAAWVLLNATRYQYEVHCSFAAPQIALLSDALPSGREESDLWFNAFNEEHEGDVFDTRTTGVRLTVGGDLNNTPDLRDAYFVSLQWHEVPE